MADHQRFTAEATAYLRALSSEDRHADVFAVHYQHPPRATEHGESISLRFPVLIVAGYVTEPEAIAQKVARILEKHWDEEDLAA